MLVLLASCTSDDVVLAPVPGDIDAPGLDVEVVVNGLRGPTQLVVLDNGDLLVSQLNGGENEESGQIIRIDRLSNVQTVLFDGLDKPTGVSLFGGDVWVMQRDSLWRGRLQGGDLEPVLQDLPSNGRSEGTLTPYNEDELLYITSGSHVRGQPVDGSGTVFTVDAEGSTRTLATGFKNAYGHAVASDGTLWVTEISDGTYDGEPAQDEVGVLVVDQNHGWPWCVGANRMVKEFAGKAQGGGKQDCEAVPSPSAVFAPGATPTSVAIAPWDSNRLLVSLWNEGVVVEVASDSSPPDGLGLDHQVVVAGVDHPQFLLADGDRVLLVDFDRGLILSLRKP